MSGHAWWVAGVGTLLASFASLTISCGGKEEDNPRLSSSAGAGGKVAEPPGGTSSADPGESMGGSTGGGGASPAPGMGGESGATERGGAGSVDDGGAGAGGASEVEPGLDPYAPRSGPFAVLVYSRTKGYSHASIEAGEEMLRRIAVRQGFEVVVTSSNELFTPEGLAPFELVYFNNTSGPVLSAAEHRVYEDWMRQRHGAFAGHHSATDTEHGWEFYAEVTGQYHDGHRQAYQLDNVVFEADAAMHPAVKGFPNPWRRAEEWMLFNSHEVWSAKPGFHVLGRKEFDGQPIVWTREWGNFRAFYTGLGHDKQTFVDPDFERHVTGGVMWSVRREHLIAP